VAAFIVARPGKFVDTNAIKSLLKTHLSPFKVPKAYTIVDELPKNATGKILKRELRKQMS